MDADGSTADLPAVLGRAVALRRDGPDGDDDGVRSLLQDARRFGRAGFDAAVALLDSADRTERSLACDLLASLCDPDEEAWGPEVAAAVIRLAEHEDDPAVLTSVASALGHAADHQGVRALARLTGHADVDVRLAVARSLPSCEEGADSDLLSQALIGLMDDPDAEVRDWATFGLGEQTELDGADVRAALVVRVDDDHLDTRDGAILGLARRRDHRAPAVVEARLREVEVGTLAVEAAAYLADARLVTALHALESWWDVDPDLLAEAVDRCDPGRTAMRLAGLTVFGDLLAQALADRPDIRAWLCCDRFGRETFLDVEHGERTGSYDFERLMERAAGDPGRAVETVLAGADADRN